MRTWQFPGRFLVLEGGDCSGKTTQIKHIKAHLESRGIEVVTTREPGGSPLAEAIRGVVLSSWQEGVPPITELLMMFAARAAHLQATILPALRARKWVLSDRFLDSTYVFQGHARGVDLRDIDRLADMTVGSLRPDLTLVFDVSPEVAAQRATSRGGANRFDLEGPEFMAKVRQGFLMQASMAPGRYSVINANESIDQVSQAARKAVDRLIDG